MRLKAILGWGIAATLMVTPLAGEAQAQKRLVPGSKHQIQLSFAPIVKQVAPAVVNVHASRVQQQGGFSPFFDDPFFKRFFEGPGFNLPRKRMQKSLGSGVIINESGIIITNHHVIKNANEVRVALSDKREFDCDIVLRDPSTDLAILKIRGRNGPFPFVKFADSDRLEVGDLVLAIGNPFGVGQTVTQGIVSALARTRVGVADYQFFIQTDAAINPGNSGGALIDMSGQLVGINTAIYSRSGGSNGIGFAIPSNMAKLVAKSSRKGGRVERPWLGARLQVVTPDIAEGLGLDRPRGALVANVVKKSPAAKAGMRVGDLILTVDGDEIEDPNGFGYRFATKEIGGSARFGIMRNGRKRSLQIALRRAPELTPRDERIIKGRSPFAGATVVNMSPAVADEYRLSRDATGVVVVKIRRGSPAHRAGLRRGDVLLEVNRSKVDSTRTLAEIAREQPILWRFSLMRNGQMIRMAFRG